MIKIINFTTQEDDNSLSGLSVREITLSIDGKIVTIDTETSTDFDLAMSEEVRDLDAAYRNDTIDELPEDILKLKKP